jgi:hypothetical protein
LKRHLVSTRLAKRLQNENRLQRIVTGKAFSESDALPEGKRHETQITPRRQALVRKPQTVANKRAEERPLGGIHVDLDSG